MNWQEVIILIVYSLLLAGIIVIIIFREKIFERIERPKVSAPSPRVQKILQKYFKEKEAQQKELEKLEIIEAMKVTMLDEIETKSTEMTEKAEATIRTLEPEEKLIEQGGKMFTQFSIGLENALPRDEKERVKDMGDLIDAIKILESLDKDHYEQEIKDDTGKGMFFDQITSKLYRAMRKEEFTKDKLFVFDKLVTLGLKTLKNTTRKDLHDALNFMKEAYYIKDYLVINPELTLISRKGDIPTFSKSETVVLALAYEEHPLHYSLLLEKSKWSESYANSVIDNLVQKELAERHNGIISLIGFETPEEKAERKLLEEKLEENLKEKARLRKEQQLRLEQELRSETYPKEKSEEIKSEFEVDEEEFEDIIGSEFIEDNTDFELNEDAMIEGIMTIFENYEHMNGGLMDIRLIHQYLSELYIEITVEQILNTLDSLMEMGLVREVLNLSGVTIVLFKEIPLDEEMKILLGTILENGWMDKTEIGLKLGWDEEQTLNVMKRLQDVGLLRLDEKNRVVIPGLFIQQN
ncbi:MAG: hypothetical protein JW776_07510 [Candidatus Lokiarchaeota archaeon]|nr:hypothetical protein [Candidatus Lokiarchaeota archaeon]